ncbi:MAG: VWA domain-containing protein, partial [Acidobacteria bacterium]|nr:VWA domain-containing protein [Acidobacteriota bacterium]
FISAVGAGETGAPEVQIITPTPSHVVVGRTLIVVEAVPAAGRRIVEVRMFVDGERLAVLIAPPYEVVFDAGDSFAPRTLRVEAEDDLGHVGVHFSATRYISYLEHVEVEAEAVAKRSVLVTVLDREDEPILDLEPEEFALRVDGKPEILLEAAPDQRPLAVELQLDISGSILPYLALVKRAAERFVNQLDQGDGTEVSLFAGSTLAISPFSHDHEMTRSAILGVQVDPLKGLTVLNFGQVMATEFNGVGSRVYDAMAYSVETINVQPGQRSIVVFTDAFDTGSRISPTQIFDVIRRSNLRIDAVRFGKRGAGEWVSGARQINILRKTVHETGGQEWRIKKPEQIVPMFQRLARQLKARYRLVFVADPKTGPRERYRKLQVSVARPHVRVLAPSGFYDGGITRAPLR